MTMLTFACSSVSGLIPSCSSPLTFFLPLDIIKIKSDVDRNIALAHPLFAMVLGLVFILMKNHFSTQFYDWYWDSNHGGDDDPGNIKVSQY